MGRFNFFTNLNFDFVKKKKTHNIEVSREEVDLVTREGATKIIRSKTKQEINATTAMVEKKTLTTEAVIKESETHEISI